MRIRWYRFTAVIVGRESGHRSDLPFIRFRHYTKARQWCIRMNDITNGRDDNPLTYFEAVEIR